jgi:site-specific recombinase
LQASLLDALTCCVGQVNATGYSAKIRTRLASRTENTQHFHDLPTGLKAFRQALQQDGPHSPTCQAAAQSLKLQLGNCRHTVCTIYSHLQKHGISVGIVFRLRQLPHLLIHCKHLLEALLTHAPVPAMLALLAHLRQVSHDSRSIGSIGSLWAADSHMLAEKVAQRSAERGEHWITRNGWEYRRMLGKALGGGAEAHDVLSSVSLQGPLALFAAFTVVLLFAYSIIAGWVKNAFVLHQLGSALRYHPRLRR